MHFRSCSGELNRQPRFYHSGETGDLAVVVDLLVEREPSVRLARWARRSGGNVLLKWLGERGRRDPRAAPRRRRRLRALRPRGCARGGSIGACTGRSTRPNFLRTMRRKVRDKARSAIRASSTCEAAGRARTFAEYDRVVTAPLNGFADERRLLAPRQQRALPRRHPAAHPPHRRARRSRSSAQEVASGSRSAALPGAAEFVPAGGHAAFLEGAWPWSRPHGPSAGRWISWPRSSSAIEGSASVASCRAISSALPVTTASPAALDAYDRASTGCSDGTGPPSTCSTARWPLDPESRAGPRGRGGLPLPRRAFRRGAGERRAGAGGGDRSDARASAATWRPWPSSSPAGPDRAEQRHARAPRQLPARPRGLPAALLHLVLAGTISRDAGADRANSLGTIPGTPSC